MPQRLFLDRLRANGATPPYVFLETRRPGVARPRSFFFGDAADELRLRPGDDAPDFFARLERALRSGLWAAGYVAYEAGYLLEPALRPLLGRVAPDASLAWFGLFRPPVASDAVGGTPIALAEPTGPVCRVRGLRLGVTRARYGEAFARVRDAICAGDVYQVDLTTKAHADLNGTAEALYLRLRTRQRAAYSACLRDGERAVVSLSPERFLTRRGDMLSMQPMKGTAPRGRDADEDDRLRRWLAGDEKNRAENVMIVDMVRNDLGRVARAGSVAVDELFAVEPMETVWQMTSTVSARLRAGTSWGEVMRAVFPCASVTGAPKIRAMEMIAELEQEARGVYTGAIGYISPQNDASFSVAIRTAVVDDTGHAELGLGSGVVFDSDVDGEYEECLIKGKFMTDLFRPLSLFETMRLEDGVIDLRDEHQGRLARSARALGIPCETEALRRMLDGACRENPRGAFRLRLAVDEDGAATLVCEPLVASEPGAGDELRVAIWPQPVDPDDPMLYHKTTEREIYDRAREQLDRLGVDEMLLVNTRGEVTEGTITNVFAEIGETLWTPPLSCGLLPGTLRQHLIDTGRCRERVLHPGDLVAATRTYVGNSVRGLQAARLVATDEVSGGSARASRAR